MLWLYRLVFLPALLVLAPRYLLRMRKRGGYRADFAHRFGAHPVLPPKQAGRPRVWLQAVSVGEMLAIGPLLEGLKRDGAEIYLTTTTSTGYRLALDRYAAWVVGIGYFPIDWWLFSAKAWRRIAPDLSILTEGERWPEHLAQARRRSVPVVCINGRLSDRSFNRMRRWPAAARLMVGGLDRVLAAAPGDAERFAELGVPRHRVTVTGNIKLDVRLTPLDAGARAVLRAELGLPAEGAVLAGASTWPGEEAALVAAWRAARAAGIACVLLIVPRHAERRDELEKLLAKEGVRAHFRSKGRAHTVVEAAVGDTTGELRKLLQLADLVFVGKSLPPHTEGQTPVEAAALAKPILCGPGMSNFRAIVQDLKERGAAQEVADPAALTAATLALLRDDAARGRLAVAAAAWRQENGGALDRTLGVLRDVLAAKR